MRHGRAHNAWTAPIAAGTLLVVVLLALLAASPVLRHYWPLPILSAVVVALPVLVRDAGVPRSRPLPVHTGPKPTDEATIIPALRASAISLPKAAAVGGENDDAFGIDTSLGCAAVADGASSSYRAGDWARALCGTFIEEPSLPALPTVPWTERARSAFGSRAVAAADWWTSDAAHRGAHAAFVGLTVVRRDERIRWRATAVGDCVLVHLRQEFGNTSPIVTAFPIAHSTAFPANPVLLSSEAEGDPPIAFIEGPAQIGDVWLLMSDELARWTLRRYEAGEPPWELLANGSASDVASAVRAARDAREVADDDMTIVRCEAVAAG
ncbi:MAG: protein phosphatase 2C domain-containing protein [Pseudonocardia sp.]|nr:protein phosphatase 2C domain-containing protein [Pseudonocardia sp.]